jgi:hypothetical protein
MPFKVLDAPALADDFYLSLVDWSAQNVLAVALGSSIYLWSACTSKVRVCTYSCMLLNRFDLFATKAFFFRGARA